MSFAMIPRYLISIRNIPWTVSHSQLEEYFSTFGSVKTAKVIFDKYGVSTGYGFVEFYNKVVVTSVLNKVHVLEGQKLFVINGLQYLHKYHVKQFVEQHILDANTFSK